jgi:hypothetical protein
MMERRWLKPLGFIEDYVPSSCFTVMGLINPVSKGIELKGRRNDSQVIGDIDSAVDA